MIKIKDSDVENILSEKPIIIKAGAEWCGPCKAIKPTLEEVEKEFPDILFCEIDVDEAVDFSEKYKLRSVPTLLFFKEAKEVDRLVGNVPKEKIVESINKIK